MRSMHSNVCASRQQGVVLIFAMIALVILLIGAVAMVRSMSVSLFTAGNFGFKRDLVNQSERVLQERVIPLFTSGALASGAARENDRGASNYSAAILPVNAQGIPTALLSGPSSFEATYSAGEIVLSDQAVTLRYVVDRLCTAAGAVNSNACLLGVEAEGVGINSQDLATSTASGVSVPGKKSANPIKPVYRISIRASGPRRTESYFQTTFTVG